MEPGILVISLDFELYWGVRDKKSVEQFRSNLLGAREAIPQMLRVFRENGLHATWATVGFLFLDDRQSLLDNLPKVLPSYSQGTLSPYPYIQAGTHLEPQYHFAPELIKAIDDCPGQEIGTHTFSHYYCLEKGQTLGQFEADLCAAVESARARGIELKSIVFPRNQWSPHYLSALTRQGIQCYRGNQQGWIYRACAGTDETLIQRALRLLDAYVNLSGHHTYPLANCIKEAPFNFPASRFLRPYSPKLASLDGLRMHRIKSAMLDAAVNGKVFHLWWHPHNFGTHTENNIDFLTQIADQYRLLHDRNGMRSMNMEELCQLGVTRDGRQTTTDSHAVR